MKKRLAQLSTLVLMVSLLFFITTPRAEAAIAINTSKDCIVNVNPCSYTVGSGSNRMLIVGLFGDNTDGGPSITYNGTAMTNLTPGGVHGGTDRYIWFFYLLNPSTGANNLVLSWTSSPGNFEMMAADYSGVSQTGQPDASGTNTSTGTNSLSKAITVVAANSWLIAVVRNSTGQADTFAAGVTNKLKESGGLAIGDSNGTVSTGSVTSTITENTSSSLTALVVASFAPDVPAGAGPITNPPDAQVVGFVSVRGAVLIR